MIRASMLGDLSGSIKIALVTASLVALAASIIEGIVLWRLRRGYDWREMAANVGVAIGRNLTNVVPIAVALPFAGWLYEHRIWSPRMDSPLTWVALFFGLEFFYYWFHRASHRVRWFWATHAVHHSSNSMNFSSAYRLGWTGRLTGALAFFVPLAWLGFPPLVIAAAFTINLLYQFWIHSEWMPKLGFLEGVLNTPSAHRVHHAANLDYLDANYGGVLMIFDRMFGTYVPERAEEPVRYGLVVPLKTYNPFKIAFFQWVALVKDLARARSLRDVLGYLFAAPGWAPDGKGLTTEDLRRNAAR